MKNMKLIFYVFFMGIILISCSCNENNPLEPTGNIIFDGGFETGDTSQWDAIHWNQNRPLSEQLEIVTNPVKKIGVIHFSIF